MTHSKLSRWVKRGAFSLIACAAFAMISAEQAQAQYYGGRGVSIGSFGRGGGFNLSIGNSGLGYGNVGGFNRGYSGRNYGGYGGFNSGYRYAPQRSYYRGGGYGGGQRGYYGRY